jgi:molybdopterin molybdotransferase
MKELGPSPLISDGEHLSVDQARAAIAAALTPLIERETVGLADALGRVLADDVISPIDVPAHDNSAMDGYALAAAELRSDGPTRLRVVGTAFAGTPWAGQAAQGECLRIMTGAVLPAGLDTVVPQELVTAAEGFIQFPAGTVKPQENRRLKGEDLARGRARGRGRSGVAPGRHRVDRLAGHPPGGGAQAAAGGGVLHRQRAAQRR